jgi:hypothetical protein
VQAERNTKSGNVYFLYFRGAAYFRRQPKVVQAEQNTKSGNVYILDFQDATVKELLV